MERTPKSHKILTLEEQIHVLQDLDNGILCCQVAEELGVGKKHKCSTYENILILDSFFFPLLCSVNSDHDNRFGVWHISFNKTKKKRVL